MTAHPYRGCRAALATAHGKAEAIAPAMKSRLEIEIVVPIGLDTDALGSFSGEVVRSGTMEEALVRKAHLGLQAADFSLGIASEGSYGPHPYVPFIGAGLELMILIDTVRGYRIQESLFEGRPVFETAEVADLAEITPFIERSRFPSHAAIVRPTGEAPDDMLFKGLQRLEDLEQAVRRCIDASPDGRAQIQTDMRAHMNPTRMNAIARLASRFADRLLSLCPMCDAPGFGRTGGMKGLPCTDCGWPTDLVREEIYGCHACGETETRPRSDGLLATGPSNCPNCNP